LREAIAAHLRATRGVQCSADQVLVISNIDRACQLVTSLLLDEGDLVWIEDPGYLIPRFGLLGSGVRQVPVPVDAEGLDLAAAIRRAPRARLACVLPSLHYPLGVTMSLQRRLSLLDWARRADAWILEIDFGCEFRFRGRPLEALQGLDRNNRVIYYGTFRQMLFPGVNLSYLVVPRDLADDFAAARVIVGPQPASVYQAVMADFMAEGHFTRHVRRMRRLYAQKRATFLKAAAQHLDGTLEFQPADGGFHLVGWLPRGMDDVAAADEAARHDVHVTPLSSCAAQPPERGALIMGTGALNVRQIWNGVIRLAAALSKLK
jgi:GntR family transcriptional regulator/MocR family aminotransferase